MVKRKETILLRGLIILFISLYVSLFSGCLKAPELSDDENKLEYVSPEEVGWSSEKLEEARKFAEKIGSAAVMVLYDGKVFISWGNVATKYKCHSIRKPFLSALYGIHVERGEIDLDATLEELKIDDIPPSLTPEEKRATVRDLLKSRSGVYHEAAAEAPIMIETRPKRGSHPPDTFYYYNNWDFNALGTIFEQETGFKIFKSFKKEIADPLGMEDFSVDDCLYNFEREKSKHPGYHFRMTARDMARFGLLYQRNGRWKDRQIIPPGWIKESTTAYSIVEESLGIGYGYMWNVVTENSSFAELFGGHAYYHTGLGVHNLAVMPERKLVFIYRINTDDDFVDPGQATIQLVMMILNARLSE